MWASNRIVEEMMNDDVSSPDGYPWQYEDTCLCATMRWLLQGLLYYFNFGMQ